MVSPREVPLPGLPINLGGEDPRKRPGGGGKPPTKGSRMDVVSFCRLWSLSAEPTHTNGKCAGKKKEALRSRQRGERSETDKRHMCEKKLHVRASSEAATAKRKRKATRRNRLHDASGPAPARAVEMTSARALAPGSGGLGRGRAGGGGRTANDAACGHVRNIATKKEEQISI